MNYLNSSPEAEMPAIRRLQELAPLDAQDLAALRASVGAPRHIPARREMPASIWEAHGTVLILEGWAHRSGLLADGRRQITGILLPGDTLASSSVAGSVDGTLTAITPLTYCLLPNSTTAPLAGLTQALDANRAIAEKLLRRQVVRLGRLDASERLADWLLEIYERLEAVGSSSNDTMSFPATQEVMADALGLTSVHINRVLSVLRRDDILTVQGGRVVFHNRDRCRSTSMRF
jgi:CRP-like cAMP-binding protein